LCEIANGMIEHKYSPKDFRVGEEIRIYLAWATNQDIFVRGGVVVNPNRLVSDGRSSLELEVQKVGKIEREEPRNISAVNTDGHTVSGRISATNVDKYIGRFQYSTITRVDRLNGHVHSEN